MSRTYWKNVVIFHACTACMKYNLQLNNTDLELMLTAAKHALFSGCFALVPVLGIRFVLPIAVLILTIVIGT